MGETNLEMTERNIKDFIKVQKYMILAKKEEANETYAELKSEYIALKAILTISGVNLAELDTIKE